MGHRMGHRGEPRRLIIISLVFSATAALLQPPYAPAPRAHHQPRRAAIVRLLAGADARDEQTILAGRTPWGGWSQSADNIHLEVSVNKATRPESVYCTVQVGILDIYADIHDDDPVVAGMFALPVHSNPEWTLEEKDNGIRTICVDIRKRDPTGISDQAPFALLLDPTGVSDQALFSRLLVDGEEIQIPGLVSGNYKPMEGGEDEQDGSDDGSVPGQRGR